MVIPFEIDETVYVVVRRRYYDRTEKVVGYDHLGPIGGYEYHYFTHYEIQKRSFSLFLLGQFGIDEIFKSYQEAQAYKNKLEAEK